MQPALPLDALLAVPALIAAPLAARAAVATARAARGRGRSPLPSHAAEPANVNGTPLSLAWPLGVALSLAVAAVCAALAVLDGMLLAAAAAAPLEAVSLTAASLAASAAGWLACSICIAVGCRPLNRVDPTGALPRGDPNVTARLLAALAASSLVHAVRLALADDSDGSDEARMVVVLDGAMAAASFAGFVVESMRWSRIACRRADALESHLAARTDGAGHKIPVPSPEVSTSMFDHVFCNWITPFLRKGMAKTIESHDLWDLRDSDRAENVLRVFERSSKPGTRLYWRLFAAFWPLFFSNAFFCVVVVVLDYMPSILTNLLLQLIANANSGDEDRDPSIGRVRLVAGILMSLGFVASGIMQSLLELQIFCYQGRRAGLHIRSVLTTLIFNKSLRLASAGQQPSHQSGKDNNNNNKKGKNNTAVSNNNNPSKDKDNDIKAGLGKIVTLMSVDANQFQETFSLIVFLSLAPARIFVSVAALYSLLGWPALASVGLTIVTSPFVSLVTRFQHKMISKYLRTMDRRISNVNEMLQGIRIIKFFGWEAEFQKKIEKSRDAELRSIIGVFISQALSNLVWEPIPLLISFLTFSLYAGPAGGKLDAPLVFTSLALIMTLRYPVNDIPRISMNLNQMWVSLRRIEDYLNLPELDKFQPDKQHLFESDWNEISTRPGFRNATFTWDSDAKADAETAEAQAAATEHDPLLAADSQPPSLHHHFVLSDVHVTFPVGCLTAVVGVTGAGKSSIAQALLGEMTMLRGRTVFPSVFSRGAPDFGSRDTSVAYVAQTAWLQNASVRDNILFGAPFDEQRYNHVIEACALVRDLATFPAGDMTEIGEKGINMSGGQKQRISLARACYSAAQFVILDDPLSAVDAPTALHLFDKCIRGILRGRTVVLVTHATGLVLPSADHVVYVKNGRIAAHGSGVDMQQQLEELDDSFGEHLLRALRGDKVDGSVSHSAGSSTQQAADPPADDDDAADSGKHDASGRLVEKETKQSGSVDPAVYLSYLRAVGGIGFIGLYLFVAALGRGAQVADDWWLKIWAEAYKTTQDTTHANVTIATSLMIQTARSAVTSAGSLSMSANDSTSGAAASPDSGFYIGVYGALGLGVILLDQMVIVLYSVGSYRASKTMHNAMLARILNAPMRFFDTTPVGRILNRFSNDIESIDTEVSGRARELLHSILLSLCSLGVAAVVSPFLPLLFIPVAYGSSYVSKQFITTARELRRIESLERSPIYAKFAETLQGAGTIRALAHEKRFMAENMRLVDRFRNATFLIQVSNRWLSLRCEILAAVMTFATGLALVVSRRTISPGLAGISLSYAIQLVFHINRTIRAQTALEVSLNSIERVDEYLNIDQEAAAIVPSYRPADNWPTHGAIDIQDLSVRYAPDQPRVLDGVSFSVGACEKVGIVGRTGAGKSTLSLALFRIVPHDGGRIVIDGMDIGRMGLWDLRSRLTIIPQDPVLFAGTVRSNLDPFDKHDDAALWASLQRVHFLESLQTKMTLGKAEASDDGSLVSGSDSGSSGTADAAGGFSLDSAVSENGANFSQGQRQLLCLARALLQASRIIVLDEATASVDHATDAKIQSTIRTEFSGATVLTIAHRLSTVMDYDKILVLNHGRVVQFGRPHDLLQDTSGQLYQMCAESGEMDLLVSIAAGQGSP